MHESGSARRVTEADAVSQRLHEHVLDVAKWPEQEQVWDIARWDEANLPESQPLLLQADAEEKVEVKIEDNTPEIAHGATGDASPLRLFPVEADEPDYKAARIMGGILVGLLIVGGGLYAYETMSTSTPVATLAMTPPMRGDGTQTEAANPPAGPAYPSAPPSVAALDTAAVPALHDSVSSRPGRTAFRSRGRSAPRQVIIDDDPINAPMTLTPETAPPPQQSGPAGQIAAQRPMTAAVVSGRSFQPVPTR